MINIFIGTIINAFIILLAGLFGVIINKKLNKETAIEIMSLIALIAMITGFNMALKSNNILLALLSLAISLGIGIYFKVDEKINKLIRVQDIFQINSADQSNIFSGMIIASMISLIGPLAIIGSIQSGISGDIALLILKSGFDFIATLILAASLGKGVIYSVIPIFIIQSLLVLLGHALGGFIPAALINELSATGGVILIAMAMSVIGVKHFKVISLIFGLLLVPIFYLIFVQLKLL
ncbi:MAG: DUF554 family protein [bacterium]